jgi:hypothetical protein
MLNLLENQGSKKNRLEKGDKKMKKIYIFLLSFMLLFGTIANAFAARKGSSHRSSTSYKSARPKNIRVKSYTRKDGTVVRSHYRSHRK